MMRSTRWLCVTAWLLGGCGDDGSAEASPDAIRRGVSDSGGGPSPLPPGNSEDVEPEPAGSGCDNPTATLGTSTTIELQYNGKRRSYILHAPAGIDPGMPTPLVLSFHGLTSNAARQQEYAGNAVADERDYVVAYPQGLGDSFNAGPCCSMSGKPPHSADDVGFAKAVIADVATKLCIDVRRIYSTGMSNGGLMSEHNACEAADVYAAVAPVSAMALARPSCRPSRPIPMIAFNGTADHVVNYAAVSDVSWPAWVEREGCTREPRRETHGASYCDVYEACDGGVELKLCTVTDMAHCWPGNPLMRPGLCPNGGGTDIDANTMMYDFFERFALPD